MQRHKVLFISAAHEDTLATWYPDAEAGGCLRIHRHFPDLTVEQIAELYEPDGYRLVTKMVNEIPTHRLVLEEKISTAFGIFEED